MIDLKKLGITGVLTGVLAFTVACGPEAVNTSSNNEVGGNSNASSQVDKKLEGEIKVDGSSTVFPIMEAVAEEYNLQQPDVKVPIGVSGTGGGFEAFIAGTTDISNASRPIKDEEKEALKAAGIEYTEFEIAYDGLSVVVSKENTWVDHLTVDELKKMWIEDGKVKKWSDIREGWPEEEIVYYSPGADSGTFDYFDEVILDGEQIVKSANLSEDDNQLVTGIVSDKNAIGYFGYAYYLANKDKLKVVPIDGGNGPVEPTNETVENGTYSPLSRSLFIYVKNESVERPEVYDFLKYLLTNVGDLAEEVGYVRTPEANYEEAIKTLDSLK